MIFGVPAAVIASVILILSYAVLFSEKLNRAVAVMLGAAAMVLLGVLSYDQALKGIDFNTIALLIGMMIMVGIMEKSGAFQYAAVKSAKLVKANPRGILAVLGVVTAVLSAFLDNVTTVLLIVPVTIEITRKLKLNPYPFLLMEIFFFKHRWYGNAYRRPAEYSYRRRHRAVVYGFSQRAVAAGGD